MKKWAVGQVDAGTEVEENLETALRMIEEASEDGCNLIAFPEFFLVRGNQERTRNNPISLDSKPVEALCQSAKKHGIHLIAGTIPVPVKDEENYFYNTAIHIDCEGILQTQYRKIHLFDIELEGEFTLRESNLLAPGNRVVDGEVDGLHAGFAICYDLRFPELFRQLADRRVQMIFLPSNFTRETGRAHWEPLIRARAIENQCYIVAPNQWGSNRDTGIASLGQSMVVDPWGQVTARASDGEGWFSVRIDPDYVHEVRRQLPALDHVELL